MSKEPNLIDFIDHQLGKLSGNPDYTLMMQALMAARAAMTTKPCAEVRSWWPLGVGGGKQLTLIAIDHLPPDGTKLYAFDAPPAATGESLDLIAAHKEIAELKQQLATMAELIPVRRLTALQALKYGVNHLPFKLKVDGTTWRSVNEISVNYSPGSNTPKTVDFIFQGEIVCSRHENQEVEVYW